METRVELLSRETAVEPPIQFGVVSFQKVASKLSWVQALRALAAFLVVLVHVRRDATLSSPLWINLSEAGYAGVDVFFVLSGFIIFHIHRLDLGLPNRAVKFVRKRLIRIFPLYWIVVACKVAMSIVSGPHYSVADVVFSALLLDLTPTRVLGPSWSLTIELYFYAIFLVGILSSRRAFGIGLALWTGGILLASVLLPSNAPMWLEKMLSVRNLAFVFGIAVAWSVNQREPDRKSAIGFLAVGGLIFVTAFAGIDFAYANHPSTLLSPYLGTFPFAVGTALALYGLVELEQTTGRKAPRLLTFVGDASYSVYLTHIFAGNLVWAILRGLHFPLGTLFISVLAPIMATALGCGVYVAVERPLLSRLRRFA